MSTVESPSVSVINMSPICHKCVTKSRENKHIQINSHKFAESYANIGNIATLTVVRHQQIHLEIFLG